MIRAARRRVQHLHVDRSHSEVMIGLGAAGIGALGRVVRTRRGHRQYEQFLHRMDQLVAQAQDRAAQTQRLIHDRTETVADMIKDTPRRRWRAHQSPTDEA